MGGCDHAGTARAPERPESPANGITYAHTRTHQPLGPQWRHVEPCGTATPGAPTRTATAAAHRRCTASGPAHRPRPQPAPTDAPCPRREIDEAGGRAVQEGQGRRGVSWRVPTVLTQCEIPTTKPQVQVQKPTEKNRLLTHARNRCGAPARGYLADRRHHRTERRRGDHGAEGGHAGVGHGAPEGVVVRAAVVAVVVGGGGARGRRGGRGGGGGADGGAAGRVVGADQERGGAEALQHRQGLTAVRRPLFGGRGRMHLRVWLQRTVCGRNGRNSTASSAGGP